MQRGQVDRGDITECLATLVAVLELLVLLRAEGKNGVGHLHLQTVMHSTQVVVSKAQHKLKYKHKKTVPASPQRWPQ